MKSDAGSGLLQRYSALLKRLAEAQNLQQIRSNHVFVQQTHADVSTAAPSISCEDVAGRQLLHMLVAAQNNCLLLLSKHPHHTWGGKTLPHSTIDAACVLSSTVVALMSLMHSTDDTSREMHMIQALVENGESHTCY
jgi:hypothetical protein